MRKKGEEGRKQTKWTETALVLSTQPDIVRIYMLAECL